MSEFEVATLVVFYFMAGVLLAILFAVTLKW